MGPAKQELEISKLNIQEINKMRKEAATPGSDQALFPHRKSLEHANKTSRAGEVSVASKHIYNLNETIQDIS